MHSNLERNYLVTGGAGFIGSHLVRQLLRRADTARVVNLDALTYAASLENLSGLSVSPAYVFIKGSIRDQNFLDVLLRTHRINVIVHCAAESHVDRSIATPMITFTTNIMGTAKLLEAARNYWLNQKHWDSHTCRFHYVSTDEVYGSLAPNDPPCVEETRFAPSSPYAASKAAGEHLVSSYGQVYGLPITISRGANNYGPYQHQEKFIPLVIHACRALRPITLHGEGEHRRSWLYVGDHCQAIQTILDHGLPGECYNVGGEEQSTRCVADAICVIMGDMPGYSRSALRALRCLVPDRPANDLRYALDSRKLKHALGWVPRETLTSGLEKTVAWYCQTSRQ